MDEAALVRVPTEASCEIRDSPDSLQQGDIFRAVDPTDPTTGVVVTADCDIAEDKAWDVATWVPVVPLSSYAASGPAFRELKTQLPLALAELATRITSERKARSLSPLDQDLLRSELLNINESDLAEICGINDGRAPKDFETTKATLFAIHQAAAVLEASPPRSAPWPAAHAAALLKALVALLLARGAQPQKFFDRLRSLLISHPGDVFFIYAMPGMVGDTHFAALLRFLREVRHAQIASTIGEARRLGLPYYRFAGLVAPYKYELTRRLGAVFSDIGLPDHYDATKKTVASEIVQKLQGAP